jgi:secreted trypsin-like serine protease
VYSGTKYGPDLEKQVYLTKGHYLEIDTNAFSSAQTYFADLAVTTSGGYVAITSIKIEMTEAPTTVNLPPNFAAPL